MIKGNSEYRSLLGLSARIGSDPALVQAAGGNTSIKLDDTLWIKASGTWLMNALSQNIMVPVALTPLLAALNNNDGAAKQAESFVPWDKNPGNLRPSIETTVHAVFPQKVVVHVHCVETIAIALRVDAEEILASKLGAFNWGYVPYVKPGLTLSRSIAEVLDRNDKPVDVVVLGNHGLVVAANSVQDAGELLVKVCSALKQPTRSPLVIDAVALEDIASNSSYELPRDIEAHGVALDEVGLAVARGGSLYPDHVIFLGEGSVIANDKESALSVVQRFEKQDRPAPVSIVFPGIGVLMKKDCGDGAHALARCLSDVCSRVPGNARVNYLTPAQNHELLNWDAEKYRQALNKKEHTVEQA